MTRDQKLIVDLLCGNSEPNKHGLPDCRYPSEGSEEELAARRALARLLRSSQPLDPALRSALAELIDPDRDEINRQIRFVNRRKGKPSNAAAEKQVAEFIWSQAQAGEKIVEGAVSSAEQKFGLKKTRVLEIWTAWRPILEKLKR